MPGIQVTAAIPAGPGASFRRRRLVLTTFGSLGDLHPYIAVALGLQARGHEAVLATSGYYRQKVEALGLGFRAVRPDHPDPEADPELMRRVMDRRRGSEFVIRQLMMSALRDSYEDTGGGGRGGPPGVPHAHLHHLAGGREAGRPLGLHLPPAPRPLLGSRPPVLPQAPFLAKLRSLGPAFHRLLFWCARRSVCSW